MSYQPPLGAKDLLPIDVVQRHWIETKLQEVFQQWGYHWIMTSTLERVDTLVAGGAVRRETVIQIQDSEDGSLGLRPELTASIARTAVTRMAGVTHPQRLCYSATVFREPPPGASSRQREFFQTGVELLGTGGTLADAEVLLLLADSLEALALDNWHLLLGEAELTRSLLADFPEEQQKPIRRALGKLDRLAIEALDLSPELRDRALMLFDLRGEPKEVLGKVGGWDLNPDQTRHLNDLKNLIDLLENCGKARGKALPIILDLSLVQHFNYYTGIIFDVVSAAPTGHALLAQGGRYDQLLGLYHSQDTSYPGIGFSFNVEPLHQVLLKTDHLPDTIPVSDCLVIPRSPQSQAAAFAYAHNRRIEEPQSRIELQLMEESEDVLRDRIRRRNIKQIAWVAEDGTITLENV
ncbi:MAG: ATP phosphoribosyltransferase regulatory subunit [Cyanobacteria bacterium P01_D01_bin.73]